MPNNILRCDLSRFSQSLIENIADSSHLPSIAVLPFTDQDEESRRNHLGRWLADDVSHHLGRFRHLAVVGRRASDAANATPEPLRALGRKLGTRYLATGAVAHDGDRPALSVSLIESASGKQLWSAPCQLTRGAACGLEDDLAKEVATGLAVAIDAAERARLDRQDDADAGAEPACLTLMADHLTKQFRQHANQRARQLAEEALRIDPMSARAYAVLSRTHHLDLRYGWTSDPEESSGRAVELAELAIECDPMEATGHAELGMNRHYQRDYAAAHAAYSRVLEINPNDPDILADFSHLLISIDSLELAIEPLRMAIRLRPDRAGMYRYYLACGFYILGDDRTVISLLSPVHDNREGHRVMAASYARMGLPEQAAYQAHLAMTADPQFTLAHWRTILPHRDPDLREHIIEQLARAGLP